VIWRRKRRKGVGGRNVGLVEVVADLESPAKSSARRRTGVVAVAGLKKK